MVKKQLSDAGKGRAIGLIEDAGWSITDVASTLGVSRWTIMRLIASRNQNPGSEVPVRKKGTGLKKKWGRKEADAIERALDRNPYQTSLELKMRMPKTLKSIDARTVRRITREYLDRPASVAPEKPFLTDELKSGRIEWVNTNLRKRKSTWDHTLYLDEVMFEARGGGGWRLVRRPRGVNRHHPKFCRPRFRRTRKVMALAGIAADGSRFLTFLRLGQMMNSELYCKKLNKAKKILKKKNLMILHDKAKVHSSKKTQAYLKKEKIRSLMLPGKSPDLNPIENCFGLLKRKLEKKPTRSLEEVKMRVRSLWRGFSDDYLFTLCSSMRRRMRAVRDAVGEMTKY